MIKMVEPKGPSDTLLKPYDVILSLNGMDVEQAPLKQVRDMIELSTHQIDVVVRRATYEEQLRALNPRFYTTNSHQPQSYTETISRTQSLHPQVPHAPPIKGISPYPFDRLMTSVAQQPVRQQSSAPSNGFYPDNFSQHNPPNYLTLQPDRSRIVSSNQRAFENSFLNNLNSINGTSTLGRNGHNKFGKHSPVQQRCKSSIDDIQMGKQTNGTLQNQPALRRSNTMKPVRPTPKVLEELRNKTKIYFEDGSTKVLNYDQRTTVGSILETLNSRYYSQYSTQIKSYFGLVATVNLDDDKENLLATKKPFEILDEDNLIVGINNLKYAKDLRIYYRMIYPPSDIIHLYMQDKVAFEYLYKQSCNDLRLERFSPNLDEETTMKLASLYLIEYVYSNHPKAHNDSKDPKVYVKLVEKDIFSTNLKFLTKNGSIKNERERGLEHFVPRSMIKATRDKNGDRDKRQYKRLKTKMIEHLKKNFEDYNFKTKTSTSDSRYSTSVMHNNQSFDNQNSPSDHIKIVFLDYLKDFPCYKNAKREKSNRHSASPVESSSNADCSSSIDSAPRTSDSSPLIKQSRNQSAQSVSNHRSDQPNVVSKLAHMNSIRSMNSMGHTNGTHINNSIDQPDVALTPSIESISSITFNMQSSPSPQHPTIAPLLNGPLSYQMDAMMCMGKQMYEPSPLPRHLAQQCNIAQRYNSLEKIYRQRHECNDDRSIDEILRATVVPPPPPIPANLYNEISRARLQRDQRLTTYITPVLTDTDLNGLIVPPPPRIK